MRIQTFSLLFVDFEILLHLLRAHIRIASPSSYSSNIVRHTPCRTRSSPLCICDFVARDDTKDLANTIYHRHSHVSRTPLLFCSLGNFECSAPPDQCSPIPLRSVHSHLKNCEYFSEMNLTVHILVANVPFRIGSMIISPFSSVL